MKTISQEAPVKKTLLQITSLYFTYKLNSLEVIPYFHLNLAALETISFFFQLWLAME